MQTAAVNDVHNTLIGGIAAEDVYIVTGYTDMRKSIDGLATFIKSSLGMDPFGGSLFMFCGKRRNSMKALLWEDDGFVLLYKRLDNGSRSEERVWKDDDGSDDPARNPAHEWGSPLPRPRPRTS
jgi:transposase